MQDIGDKDTVEIQAKTRVWLERAVIGLNLCPFAKAVHVKNQIRYAVSGATSTDELQQDLAVELKLLEKTNPGEMDTTLLIHPFVLNDFLEYNDFLDVADGIVDDLDLQGEIQIASFHPDYQFAGTTQDDISNCTNRAPFPILHLLREESIQRAVESFPDASDIYERNIETMGKLGWENWRRLFAGGT